MPLRLAGSLGGRTLRLTLREGTNVVGSAPHCDVWIDHPTVSRSHAELRVAGDEVEVRDLGSSNGTFVDDRRVAAERLDPGAVLGFGQVRLGLERVAPGDLETAVSLSSSADRAPDAGREAGSSTVSTKPVEVFALDKLPLLLDRLAEGVGQTRFAQAAGDALFASLPVVELEITAGQALLFEARREAAGVAPQALTVTGRGVTLRVVFAHEAAAAALAPVVEAVGTLLGLASSGLAAPEPAVSGAPRRAPPPLPEPASVVPEVQRLYAEATRVARGDVGVLLCGESGTGKEVLARYVHAASTRAEAAFVALNCAALPRDLLEAELFGIERGVATGVEARAGKFELAHGGTLFLDEIGDMALETQAKILRVLQAGEVYRLGGSAPRPATVRVVAATNRDLEKLRASGAFREDLYYRVATWTATLPPLRRRSADIPNLAALFLSREAVRSGVRVTGISRGAVEAMRRYAWPGNIRQLEKEMARAVLFLGDGDLLDSSDLSPTIREGAAAPGRGHLTETLEAVERREIVRALERCAGDVARAAEELGLGRSTLYRRMKALGLEPPTP